MKPNVELKSLGFDKLQYTDEERLEEIRELVAISDKEIGKLDVDIHLQEIALEKLRD